MVSATLVQMNGSHRSFQASMKRRMASMSSRTESKLPRRMAWRVMIPKKISTMFNHDPDVGVKCSVIRGLRASQAVTVGCLWAPLCVKWILGQVVGSVVAGSGSDLSEEPVVGVEPAALEFVVAPWCPPGP